jgi:hypothetical protein
MIRDQQLEFSPICPIPNAPTSQMWVARYDKGIGGPNPYVPPTSFTIIGPSRAYPWMQVPIVGPAYTDGMASTFRPWLRNSDRISLELDVMTDANNLTASQANEMDLILVTPDGWYFNGSWQLNNQEGGQIQVYGVPPNPAWVNTGITPGKFAPNTPYHVKINYAIDYAKHTMSTPSSEINGQVFPTPASLLNVPGIQNGWAPGVYVQLQSDLNFAGGGFKTFYRNITINWE